MVVEHDFRGLVGRASSRATEVERFLKLIDGRDVVTADKCWIVGGSVRRAVEGVESRADLDVYGTADGIAAMRARLTDAGFRPKRVKGRHILFEKDFVYVDVSERHHPSPETCLDNFDFTICQFAAFYRDDALRLMHGEFSMFDLAHRILMPNKPGIEDWSRVLRRASKYHGQGFTITPKALEGFVEIARGGINADGDEATRLQPASAGPDPRR